MNYELSSFLKKLLLYDLFAGLGIGLIVLILKGQYFFPFLIGLTIALVNLIFNAVSTCNTFKSQGRTRKLSIITKILRITVVAFLGVYTYRFGAGGVLAYIGGYTCQFIGLILYGINID
ncbi:hypothetical protein [Oceanirhabdus seepicola]|uniref:ATP synthase subunit I n=1 Tax=Oceanirhabdus seepicola TaxID=2828781 RepID=A0A9J6NYF4_9CLOT|nr:hypothetical protein [Oceanirhabdus seepicola]MCM1989551.1 hypothetical protein [Oceanirhabdus seepicola]